MLQINTDPVLATPSSLETTAKNSRLASIDILRAITMVLMIFVNDLWSLSGIPVWLEHVSYEEDGMGLADTIFPAFLFIVGMSLPFAIRSRRKQGDSNLVLVKHILIRSAALLIMGVFLVNGENINEAATGMPRLVWNTLCCVSFILIWNVYPKTASKKWITAARVLGFGILLTLAFLYRGGESEALDYFSTYWWGILGLIGWSYLACALILTFSDEKLYLPITAWVIFCALSMLSSAGYISSDSLLGMIPGPISQGTLAGLTMGGVITTMLFQHYQRQDAPKRMMIVLVALAIGLMVLGFYTRTFWGISKLRATPAWLFLCSAITMLAFVGIYWLADRRKKADWFNFVKPAGYNTLLCYLIPYFAYAFMRLFGLHLPEVLLAGSIGLLKSFLFALLCVAVTGGLTRLGVRLKL
ncbi:MAG: DUF5009 domain-containing protein [Cyclobacteriaceae bacterium]